jgi:threonine dehydrogenase-like Zn-dependent dehydrogenase
MISLDNLPSTIPAGVLVSPKRLEIREIPMWPLEAYGDPDMVLIRVAACGVCGSDFRYYLGENPWAQHTLGRFVPNAPNIVLGHEYAGTVWAVADKRNEHLLGKRVAPVCSKVCGACLDCRANRSRLCENTVHMGHGQGWGERDYFPGAYSTFAPAWGASCYEIADHVSFEEAAMMDILAVCVHVAEQGAIQVGRPILTIGAGPAGNGVAQVALAMGASRAVLLERSAFAIDVANRQGVGTVIDTSSMSAVDVVSSLRGLAPEGFGSVFDTVGTASSLDLALTVLGKTGTLVNLAVHDEAVPLNFLRLGSERRIVTSCNFEIGDYPKALALLEAGRLKVKEWMTPTTLADLPGLFDRITSDPSQKGVFKLVIDPWR